MKKSSTLLSLVEVLVGNWIQPHPTWVAWPKTTRFLLELVLLPLSLSEKARFWIFLWNWLNLTDSDCENNSVVLNLFAKLSKYTKLHTISVKMALSSWMKKNVIFWKCFSLRKKDHTRVIIVSIWLKDQIWIRLAN